jgi:tRNA uridine 5-carboxymethylaminomethyl modification enzyme
MKFDIIVIGGGHAGIEAAHIATKKGLSVLMITSNIDLIGQMSCNPSIGGVAKGNIAKEIDALGGLMGKIIDCAGIHFKMLNRSKGTAVWGNRAQADKVVYRKVARKILEECKNLTLFQGVVKRITSDNRKVTGVILDSGVEIKSGAVILAAGTFLNGIAHIGLNSFPCGRMGEPPSCGLTESIRELGIKSSRLKTGTSPRIDGRTVDFDSLIKQEGDNNPWPFSFSTEHKLTNKTLCWIGRTNHETHQIIMDNMDRSPLYAGKISSIGPRYCPSIEDKVVRFGERDGHTLFLEPESLEHNEMYLNGLSTSLPFDVQVRMVSSLKGFEKAKIVRPGYGIEYDFFQPLQLKPTLESKIVENLYFAGQINGTSGYEEAACQGLIAGINASQKVLNEQEFVLSRDSSYTGVLIDDLVTRGTEEPYRMFTSRAEYRLILRQDNCDERLMPLSYNAGYLDKEIYEKRNKIWDKKRRIMDNFRNEKIDPDLWNENRNEKISHPVSALDLLKRPGICIKDLSECIDISSVDSEFLTVSVESDIKYQGFIEKHLFEIERIKKYESVNIPENMDYSQVNGLLTESKIKLNKIRPQTLGQASRIQGVTPSDISVLLIHLSKYRHVNVSRETMESGV